MPTCDQCKCNFPNRMWHQGKLINLHTRKRCIKCLPFGQRFKPSSAESPNRICEICQKPYFYKSGKGHTLKHCITCISRERRHQAKQKAIKFLGGKCEICGYHRCTRAMHFHHLDPSLKEFTISNYCNASWDKIEKELKKCILLCGNCHTEVEDGITELPKEATCRFELLTTTFAESPSAIPN